MRWVVLLMAAMLSAALIAPSLAGAGAAEREPGPLEGTWKVVQIDVFSERGENSYPNPAPGLVMFGERYYSMTWMPLTEAPADFEEVWRPTTEEMASAFGSIIVNAGTYTFTDSTLTTLPLVAKTPEFIGGRAVYNYSVRGDTLRLDMTDAVSHGGIRDPGVGRIRLPLTLVRVE
ncbi:MAG: lipocalin-like domain-containing protein [Candidatus Eisenbacteria bacterium]|nr:lipocalin-like domain-containing protein [Candidatus Eisenbacteria bacterium]